MYTTWQDLCAMYHLVSGLLYWGIFYCRFLQRLFSARSFFQFAWPSVSNIKCFVKIGILPSLSHKMDSILSPPPPPPCNFDWRLVPQYFVHRHFVRAPRDMSHYRKSKYEISIPATTHAPPFGKSCICLWLMRWSHYHDLFSRYHKIILCARLNTWCNFYFTMSY